MFTTVDRRVYAELTTSVVAARDAFAYWREMICATFVRLAAEPVVASGFSGRIEHVPVGDLELSTVVAEGQHVRRTRSLIAHSDEEYLLANIQLRGLGRVEQDGRTATLSPGDLAFYDSTRPYTLHFDDPFHQLVVQVPKRELPLRDTRQLTARGCGRGTPCAVVSTFFTSLLDCLAPHPVPHRRRRRYRHAAAPDAAGPRASTAALACRVSSRGTTGQPRTAFPAHCRRPLALPL